MSEQLKTPVPPSEFIEHDDSEVSAPTGRDILDLAERKGGEIEPRIKYLDAVRGGLNIVADTTVTSSTQASEANEISKTTRPTLIAETKDMPGAERIEKKETSVALPSIIENN